MQELPQPVHREVNIPGLRAHAYRLRAVDPRIDRAEADELARPFDHDCH
jgi:hypothetical protein